MAVTCVITRLGLSALGFGMAGRAGLTIAVGVVAYPVALSFFAPETSRRAFGLLKRVLGRKTATQARVALTWPEVRTSGANEPLDLRSRRQTRSVARRVRLLLALLARSGLEGRWRVSVVALAGSASIPELRRGRAPWRCRSRSGVAFGAPSEDSRMPSRVERGEGEGRRARAPSINSEASPGRRRARLLRPVHECFAHQAVVLPYRSVVRERQSRSATSIWTRTSA